MPGKKSGKRAPARKGGENDVAAALKGLSKAYKNAEARTGGSYEPVPDGQYVAEVIAARLNHAKSSGRFQLSWDLRIISGDFENKHVFKHDGLQSDEGLTWMKGTIENLGYECPDNIEDLPDTLEAICNMAKNDNTFAQITVKTTTSGDGREFNNVYINKAVDEDGNVPDEE